MLSGMARAEDPRRRRPVPAPLSTVGGSDMALTELGAMVIFKFAIRLANFFSPMEWQKVLRTPSTTVPPDGQVGAGGWLLQV